MKVKLTFLLLLLFKILLAQNTIYNNNNNGTGDHALHNSQCITKSQRETIKNNLRKNIKQLQSQGKLTLKTNASLVAPTFIWPIKQASGFNYNEVWVVSSYVDHNPAYNNQVQDYNGGARTYDTSSYNHKGTDISLWPFSWKMMDNNQAEVIAAAAGKIIYKHDGEYDRNCAFNSSSWNAIYIMHTDGSIAWYGHLKNDSLTSKVTGDTVAQGEYLGAIGSSGNSSGPHLHFEVHDKGADPSNPNDGNLIDPFSGPSNVLNANSWWANQKPYLNSTVNAVLTHSSRPDFKFNDCSTTEITHIKNTFTTSETVYLYVYLKDVQNGTTSHIKLIRPDNTIHYNLTFDYNSNNITYYNSWTFNGLPREGTWKVEATYNGNTVTHRFTVSNSLSVDKKILNETFIYPNPANNILRISSKINIKKTTIVDIQGKTVKSIENPNNIKRINIKSLSKGLYFLKITSDNNQEKTFKFIKN